MNILEDFIRQIIQDTLNPETEEEPEGWNPPERSYSNFGTWEPCIRQNTEEIMSGAWLIGRNKNSGGRFEIYHEPTDTMFGTSGTIPMAKKIVTEMQSFLDADGNIVTPKGLDAYVQSQKDEGFLLDN